MSDDAWTARRGTFFRMAFGSATGYICIATLQPGTKELRERFFEYPEQLESMLEHIEDVSDGNNVYFCPQLLTSKRRKKENVKYCPNAWADLDACDPTLLYVKPTLLVESSPGRFQALWSFEVPQDALTGESVSRRIAYEHADDGADKSGWDLTQLLRVPLTYNMKYDAELMVTVVAKGPENYRITDFQGYPEHHRRDESKVPFPDADTLAPLFAQDPIEYLEARRYIVGSKAINLFKDVPEGDWSTALWQFMSRLFEVGQSREQVYWLATHAACNKFLRDGRSGEALWDDVVRAYINQHRVGKTVVIPELNEVELLSTDELERVQGRETFVERYIEWASGLGDAATQYHQAGAFVILSSLLAGRVVLPTSFGTMLPNLWFMILADTTLTRKSTAMDIAIDLLVEVDPDAIMTTDGSIEGLLQGLSGRPSRPSIFLRDEFTGLLESMTKKDYMAGMAETLTKLYDGKMQKRLLRKESITVTKPVLIVFAGGIKSKTQQLLTLEHISSGFMPRFVFLTAESDTSRVLPMGPPIVRDTSGREALLQEMWDMFLHYDRELSSGPGIAIEPKKHTWNATLTPEAWLRFNKFEAAMMEAGVKSERADILTPIYDRLGKSTLKCATLLAASESRSDTVVVTELDILHAISYARRWREYAIDIINGVGKTAGEHEVDRVLSTIRANPGIARSTIMQRYHLTARSADALFQTIEQRGLVTASREGRGTHYTAVPERR